MSGSISDTDRLAEAKAIHQRHPTVDLHADPLLWSRLLGYDIRRRHRNRLPRSPFFWHSDLPRWREANVKLVLLGVVTLPSALPGRRHYRQAEDTLRRAHEAERGARDTFRLVRGARDLDEVTAGALTGGLLSLEGAHALEGSLDKLERLREQGLRAVGLAHFHRNEAVAPSWGPGGDRGPRSRPDEAAGGLSDFGRELIARLNRHRMLVDLAHTSRSGFLEAARLSSTPVLVSHTGVRGVHDHWRNIDDEQLAAVADTGGVVGIIFSGMFLGGSGVDRVVAHIGHVIDTVGDDHVALGSDFDGMIVPVRPLADVTRIPHLTAELLKSGHDEERIAKILGGNALRFLRDATGWRSTA